MPNLIATIVTVHSSLISYTSLHVSHASVSFRLCVLPLPRRSEGERFEVTRFDKMLILLLDAGFVLVQVKLISSGENQVFVT
jgi:hypothetical protein